MLCLRSTVFDELSGCGRHSQRIQHIMCKLCFTKDYDLHSALTRQIGYFGSFKAIHLQAKGENSV